MKLENQNPLNTPEVESQKHSQLDQSHPRENEIELKLSNEEEIGSLYESLSKKNEKMATLDKERKSIEKIRGDLGMPTVSASSDHTEPSEISSIEDRILEAEKRFLGVPENREKTSEEIRQEFFGSAEFKKLQKEMIEEEQKENEMLIKSASDFLMKKYSKEFKKAKNGVIAEALFRKKFRVYALTALQTEDIGVSVTFNLITLKGPEGEDLSYVKSIDMKYVNPIEARPTAIKEDDPEDIDSKKPENLDSKLLNDEEKNNIEKLEQIENN